MSFNESEIPFDQITVQSEEKSVLGHQINIDNPFPLDKGKDTMFVVKYLPARDQIGKNVDIEMKFKIKGISPITFPISDILA